MYIVEPKMCYSSRQLERRQTMLGSLLIVVLLPLAWGQTSQYIDCIPGELNVILAAPHGGDQEPSHIPTRDAGCWSGSECIWNHNCGSKDSNRCGATTVKDLYTWELTERIAFWLEELTGLAPTQVINKLHRRKLDANRDIDQATFGVPDAVEGWEAFHACINQSKAEIEASGKGLFLDIHGHGHPNVWAELGYLISGSNLDNDNFSPEQTSIYHLSTIADVDFEQLLRGEGSFGDLLAKKGFRSVPSPDDLGPNGASYFSGGDNTRMHGSRDGGLIDAIQIESARAHRDPPMREEYAEAIARTVIEYMDLHQY